MIKLKVENSYCSLACNLVMVNGDEGHCRLSWDCDCAPTIACPLYGQRDAEFEFDPLDTQRLRELLEWVNGCIRSKWPHDTSELCLVVDKIKELRGEK